ncbi:hypothetical protein K8R43_00560 [archaeon]|nr:hypothetical protein [archaeon]
MPRNCVVIVAKNEGKNPFSIAETALDSGSVDKVIISECCDKEEFKKSRELDHRRKYFKGKGAAIIDGGTEAVRQDFDGIAFIDGDLKSVETKWFPLLFDNLEEADMVKVSFLRNSKDAQITRHVIRPLISIYFPEIWQLDQPLGGELSVKKNLLKKLFLEGVAPPVTWGIDTFITTKTCALGHTMGEVFLGKKVHGKKDLLELESMFNECLLEMKRMLTALNGRKIDYDKNLFIELDSSFKKGEEHKEKYMNPMEVFENSKKEFAEHGSLAIPHEKLFSDAMNAKDYDVFFEKTSRIKADEWIETINWIATNLDENQIKEYYLRWKVRALAFCLHESNTSKEAEENTILQARKARDYRN